MYGTIPVHSLASARTLLAGVVGFGAAALVTSLSVVSAESTETASSVATIGGAAVLGASTLAVTLCAWWIRQASERLPWAGVAIGLALITAGSTLRAGTLIGDGRAGTAGVPEGVYVAGLLVLIGVAVAWPWTHRGGRSLAGPFAISAAGMTVVAAAFWVMFGQGMVDSAVTSNRIDPVQVQQFLGFLMFVAVVTAFALAGSVHLRDDPRVVSQIILATGLLAMVAGDVSWVSRMAIQSAWSPGAFGDFLHLVGHVLVAVAASFALDLDSASRRSEPAGGAPTR